MIPRAATVHLCGIEGVKMPYQLLETEIDGHLVSEAIIKEIAPENIVSSTADILTLDLLTV